MGGKKVKSAERPDETWRRTTKMETATMGCVTGERREQKRARP
jgi:hypothetical protein